jgi:hypothetical protein
MGDSHPYFAWSDLRFPTQASNRGRTPDMGFLIVPDYYHLVTIDDPMYSEKTNNQSGCQEAERLAKHESQYRWIHNYMVASGMLPRPFVTDFTQMAADIVEPALKACAFEVSICTTKKKQAFIDHLSAYQNSDVLFIMMCGHGATPPHSTMVKLPGGVLAMCGKERLSESDIACALSRFRGSLILVYCMCHAKGDPAKAAGDICAQAGESLPYHPDVCVIRIFACDDEELIRLGDAKRLMTMLADMMRQRPSYIGLQDWVQEWWQQHRHQERSKWRAPPIVQVPADCIGGTFMNRVMIAPSPGA